MPELTITLTLEDAQTILSTYRNPWHNQSAFIDAMIRLELEIERLREETLGRHQFPLNPAD